MDSRQSVHDASCQCERGSMKTEKILEIARRHILCFDDGGFIDVELIAFAQAVIEVDRQRIKQIIEEVGRQGNHDKWFDCADAIAGRIG